MVQKAVLCCLTITAGVLAYPLLALGTGNRALQALGLPLIGLGVLAVTRGGAVLASHRRLYTATAIWCVLFLAVLAEAYAVSRVLAQGTHAARTTPDSALRQKVLALAEDQAWEDIVRLAEEGKAAGDPDVLLELGYACQQLGQVAQAQTYYRKVLVLNPADARAGYGLARLCEIAGDRRGAAREYQRILKLNDALPDVHLAYGILLAGMDDTTLGARHLRRALELYPEAHPARTEIEAALRILEDGSNPGG